MLQKLSLLAASLVIALPSFAGTIADTGPVLAEQGGLSLSAYANKGMWVMAGFQVTKLSEIDGINGWVSTALAGQAGDLTVGLFSRQADGTPDEMLYSGKAFVSSNYTGWAGVSDVDVELATGSYLVGFSVASDSSFAGYMDNQTPRSGNYISYSGRFNPEDRSLEHWGSSTHLGIAFQVFGEEAVVPPDTSSVPEPSSIMLGALGIAALASTRRRARRDA